MTRIATEDIDAVCGLVEDLCGICWDESKTYLIESRLGTLVEQHGCGNYGDLVRKVRAEVIPGLNEQVVDAVTTNETLWFRDSSPFRAMQYKIVPELIDERTKSLFPKRLRIWSAACSTGQEVYSAAITLAETISDYQNWDIQILGTDISPAAVEQASRGVFNNLEMSRGMTPKLQDKYFVQLGNEWKIADEVRAMCSFKQINLLESFNELGPFDLIFCRNVAIYFSDEDRKDLFERAAKTLAPYGWLFVGSSESLTSLGDNWMPEQHCSANCYRPNCARVSYT